MSGTGGFQQQVYPATVPGLAGDFASTNPYATFDAGPGGLVAGVGGLTIGRFAWTYPPANPIDGGPTVTVNSGTGIPDGIVMRNQQGLITNYLEFAGMVIPVGFGATLMIAGDYFIKNDGSGQALPGMKAYANLADGKATFAATGAPTQGASVTGSVAASTSSVTGSITGDQMTVTAVGSGVVRPGTTLSGTGVASGTKVVSQVSGTTGGVGVYTVSIPEQTVAAGTTISGTYGTLTVSAVGSGAIAVGQVLSSGGTVTQFITGTGGTGTYATNDNTVVGSGTLTANSNIETKWFCRSAGLAGEYVKISSYPLG